MSHAPGGEGEGSSRAVFPFTLLGLLLVGVAALFWSPFPAGIWHDDGVYQLLGRSLAGGEGLRYTGVAGSYPATKFPPVYPGVLAALWGVAGELGVVTLLAGILNLAFVIAAALLFAHLLRRHLGLDPFPAAGFTALCWAPLAIWRTTPVAFSEPLFLLCLSVAFLLAARTENSKEAVSWPLLLGTVAVLLLTIHVRTAGVALAAALVLVLAAKKRRKEATFVGVGVGVGMLPWIVWSARAGQAIPEPLSDVLGSYGSLLVELVTESPGAYMAGLESGARDLADRTLTLLLPGPLEWGGWYSDLRVLGLALLVPALLLGFDVLWARSRTLVVFLFLYLAIVWLWPYRATRLLVPAAPVLVLVVALGFWGEPGQDGTEPATEGERWKPLPAWAWRAWRGAGGAWAVLLVGMSLWGVAAGWALEGYRIRSGALARTVQAVVERTPEGAMVGAPELWGALPLHAGRTSAPSARFLPGRSPEVGPTWGTPSEQHVLWALTGVDHLVLEQGDGIHGNALAVLRSRCGPESAPVIASWPEGRLVRLAWNAECRDRLGVPTTRSPP